MDIRLPRPRGPYKRWLNEPGDTEVPKTTRWRMKRARNNNDDLTQDEEGQEGIDDDNSSVEGEGSVTYNEDLDHMFDINDEDNTNANEQNDNFYWGPDQSQEDLNCDQEEPEDDPNSFAEPLYENSKVTLGQCLLLVMSFILTNGLTSSAICNLLKLLSIILPAGNLLPDTKYLFNKYFTNFKEATAFHVYCPDCKKWLGLEDAVWCDICQIRYIKEDLVKSGSFFVYIPLKDQLVELLQRPDIGTKVDYRFIRTKQHENNYEDIYDGQMYKNLCEGKLINDPNALSILFNCDGVPVFKSSNYSIWPLQAILNELPPKERIENVFLVGLWFGDSKPVMNTFLHPFTEEMKQLASTGIDWFRDGEVIQSTVHTCACSADSVARCILQNTKQFNGEFGCNWCYNPGEVITKGHGHCRVYMASDEGDKLRTHEDMIDNAQEAFEDNAPVQGVKGPCKLVELPQFDLVSGFVVDNLHCIDLGVSRQLGHLWLDSANHQEPWYIGNKTESIDERLNLIHPPNEVTRLPRSITQRAYWKGSEWHWWLLLYAPVILFGILPQRFLLHHMLLVEAVFLLTGSSISQVDINRADYCLSRFVFRFQDLYGKKHMSFNVHQLLHLTKTVTDWGPLSCYSSYIFEGFNMVLLKLFHGTQAVPKQICNTFLLYKGILSIASSVPRETDDDPVMTYIDTVLSGCTPLKKALKLQEDITFLGTHYVRELTLEEKFLAENHYGETVEGQAMVFHKAVVKGNVLHSNNYRRAVRRNNYTIGLTDKTIFEIVNFVVVQFVTGDSVTVAFGNNVICGRHWLRPDVECGSCCTHIHIVNGYESNLRLVELCNIEHKYAIIQNGHSLPGTMCCRLPNLVDRD